MTSKIFTLVVLNYTDKKLKRINPSSELHSDFNDFLSLLLFFLTFFVEIWLLVESFGIFRNLTMLLFQNLLCDTFLKNHFQMCTCLSKQWKNNVLYFVSSIFETNPPPLISTRIGNTVLTLFYWLRGFLLKCRDLSVKQPHFLGF